MDARATIPVETTPDSAKPVEGTYSVQNDGKTEKVVVSGKPAVEAKKEEAPAKGDRPSWLPEKFQSAEDFAKAYGELEKKLGTPAEKKEETTPAQTDADKATAEAAAALKEKNLEIDDFSKEFVEKGELSADSYQKLEKAGYKRSLVDAYIAGQRALGSQSMETIFNEVGGPASYQAMSDWAKTNVPRDEIAAYNRTMEGRDLASMKLAAKGLHAKYVASEGQEPNLLGGETRGNTGVKPFESKQQLIEAMKDPRYKSGDKAYHAEIDRRLSTSRLFGL